MARRPRIASASATRRFGTIHRAPQSQRAWACLSVPDKTLTAPTRCKHVALLLMSSAVYEEDHGQIPALHCAPAAPGRLFPCHTLRLLHSRCTPRRLRLRLFAAPPRRLLLLGSGRRQRRRLGLLPGRLLRLPPLLRLGLCLSAPPNPVPAVVSRSFRAPLSSAKAAAMPAVARGFSIGTPPCTPHPGLRSQSSATLFTPTRFPLSASRSTSQESMMF